MADEEDIDVQLSEWYDKSRKASYVFVMIFIGLSQILTSLKWFKVWETSLLDISILNLLSFGFVVALFVSELYPANVPNRVQVQPSV
jgi:hypothetical protein